MNKKQAFEYIILSLCQDSILKKRKLSYETYSWNDFNVKNNFGHQKLALIPFFLCVANGRKSRETLFGLFDQFYSERIGIIEKEIYEYIHAGNSDIFNFSGSELKLKNTELLSRLDNCNDRIETINCVCSHFAMDVNQLSQANYDLLVAIEKSLINLKNQTQDSFSEFSKDVVAKHSREHNVWLLNSYKYKELDTWDAFNSTNHLTTETIKNEPSIFAVEEYKLLS